MRFLAKALSPVSQKTMACKLTNRRSPDALLRSFILTCLVSLVPLGITATPALAGQGYENVTSKFGADGTEPGQFKEPTAIAVNDETEEVYVLDKGNDRVEAFNQKHVFQFEFDGSGTHSNEGKAAPTGKFLDPEGIAVDNSSEPLDPSKGDVYVADVGNGVVDKFSSAGKYEGQIGGPFSGQLNVAVDPAGNLFVYEEGSVEIYEFNDEGALVEPPYSLLRGQQNQSPGFAVDASDDIYLTAEGAIYKYSKANGDEPERVEEHDSLLAALAVISSTGNLLVDDGSVIELFKAPILVGVQPLLTFPATGLSESEGIAVNGAKGEGTIYATQRGSDDVDVFEPEPAKAPEVLSESASTVAVEEGIYGVELGAVIDPENRTTTYSFEYAKGKKAVENNEWHSVSGASLPAEFGYQTVTSPAVEGLHPLETVYYRVLAESEESKGTPTVGPVEPYTKVPLIAESEEKFSELTSTSAKLEATINPVFEVTDYTIEYATEPAMLGTPQASVAAVGVTGEGGEPEPVSAEAFGLTPGQTYYYRVVTENKVTKEKNNANEGKPVAGKIKEFTPYGAPAIVTGEAQDITRTAATLSGSVNPEGTSVTYHFAYITEAGFQKALESGAANPSDPNYREELAKGAPSPYAEGETTETNALSVGTQPVAVGPIPAADLLPGVTYHYALVATNRYAIQTIGPDRMFTTRAGRPPTVSTGAASDISQNSATLSGTVTTNGLQTNYGFEIGTEPNNYGPATGLGAIGGAASETVSVTLNRLQPGRTYYYRITATNADGTETGQPESFTTPGFPTLISVPATRSLLAPLNIAFPKETGSTGTTTKTLTKAQKLSKALKVCRKEKSRSKKAKCERQAHAKYGATKKKKKNKKN